MEVWPAERVLGRTGLTVDAIGIGCAELGNMPETFNYGVAEEDALGTIRAIFEGPSTNVDIRFVDTAASYGDGESERRIGIVLRELGGVPAGYLLATKADRDLKTGEFSGEQMRRSMERSLRLLGLDRIELLHLHDPEHAPFEELMAAGGAVEALMRLRDEGVIGHLGVAGGPSDLMLRYVRTGIFEAVITHNRYTLLNRSANGLIEEAFARGLGVINAAPYGSGILAKGSKAYPRYAYREAARAVVAKVERIEALCAEAGVPLPAVALQFSLRDPRIHSTIVGISKPERLRQTTTLATTLIPAGLWETIDRAIEPDYTDPEAGRWR
ncbi:MAG: aldo/keto reductase [Chloroflexi bacterium]|nr:aldo/keto reductase [Chloroflexota bacterium]